VNSQASSVPLALMLKLLPGPFYARRIFVDFPL
jgi:hypothetical protein